MQEALTYSRSLGITTFGASISRDDNASAEFVCRSDDFSVIHLPFNAKDPSFAPMIALATELGKRVVINRPFESGKIAQASGLNEEGLTPRQAAFKFILSHAFNGVVLTGTASSDHLQENVADFQLAQAMV